MKLDKYFQPVNSPIATREGVTSFFDFDSQNEANTVGLRNIRNFNFSSGTGGTITLGGTANGNGQLLIKNASGSTIVEGNKDGLTVYAGNLVVQNASNTTILDTSGIVSTANFPNDSAFNGAAGLSSSSSSFTDVTGSTLDSIVATRTTRVAFYLMGYGYNNDVISSEGTATMEIQVYDSFLGTSITNIYVPGLATTYAFLDGGGNLQINMDTNNQINSRTSVLNIAAGTHTYKLQYRRVSSGTAVLNGWEIGYIVLGA